MNEFTEKKQKKERGVSIKKLLEDAAKSQHDNIIIIGWKDGEETEIGYSSNSNYENISRLEIAKQIALNEVIFIED